MLVGVEDVGHVSDGPQIQIRSEETNLLTLVPVQ